MNSLIADLAYLRRTFRSVPWPDRLFVLARRVVCPWAEVVAEVPRQGRVLDVGCGRGVLPALLQRDRPGVSYVGMDVAERPLRVATAALAGPRAAFHHVDDVDWEELGLFDCVTMVDVLYAVPLEDWPTLLTRCAARLAPGGLLVVKETVAEPSWKRRFIMAQETLAIRILGYTEGEPPHFEPHHVYTDALRHCGLQPVRDRRLDRLMPIPHHLFIAAPGSGAGPAPPSGAQ